MLKTALKDSKIITAVILIVLIKLAELDKTLIEYHYTYGVYPIISGFLRIVFGWIPFSIGDLLYMAAIIWVGYKLISFFIRLFKRKIDLQVISNSFLRWIIILVSIYLVFNIFFI